MKRSLKSMSDDLEAEAAEGQRRIACSLEEGMQQLKAAAEFWRAPPPLAEGYLSQAAHVVTFPRFTMPRNQQRVQLVISAWGSSEVADLYNPEGGEYEVLVVIKRKVPSP